jgi:hypothetical protein
LFFANEEKKLKHDDKLGGPLLSPTTQEKPTSRFFSWVTKEDNKLEGLLSSVGFFFFFFEL